MQMMGLKVPRLLGKDGGSGPEKSMLCGSLCTTADILDRDAFLPEPAVGDRVVFTRCGSYSVTEGISLFLSRDLPAIYTFDGVSFRKRRNQFNTEELNYG